MFPVNLLSSSFFVFYFKISCLLLFLDLAWTSPRPGTVLVFECHVPRRRPTEILELEGELDRCEGQK